MAYKQFMGSAASCPFHLHPNLSFPSSQNCKEVWSRPLWGHLNSEPHISLQLLFTGSLPFSLDLSSLA